jgi:hypothetical protein
VTACINIEKQTSNSKILKEEKSDWGTTSSIKTLVDIGNTKPAALRTMIKSKPMPIIFFLGHINSLNAHTNETFVFFFPIGCV